MGLTRIQSILLLTTVTCLASTISGCASNGSTTVVSFDEQQTALTLIKKGASAKEILEDLSNGQPVVLRDQANAAKEAKVLATCGAAPAFFPETVISPILGLLLGSTINVLLEHVDATLKKRIEQYTSAYSAQQSVSFYDAFKSKAPNDITTDYTCLRFVRGVKGEGNKALVDFVASIKVVDSAWIEVRPERIYFSEPVALSSNQHYSVAFKLKATSIHRAEETGVRTIAFDDVIVKERVDLANKPYFLKYYEGEDRPVIRLPLLPSNVPPLDKAREFTTFEVAVAEVGNPSKGLELFASVFSGAREDIAKVLAAAANESLGWETEK